MPTQRFDPASAALPDGTLIAQDLWNALRRRKLIIGAALVLGLAAAVVYCAKAGPWYDAHAQLLVIKKRLETAPLTGPDQARVQEDYLATHVNLISSGVVLKEAIEKGGLRELDQFQERDSVKKMALRWLSELTGLGGPELPPTERVAEKIRGLLVVSRDPPKPGMSPSMEIVNLSFRGRVSTECPIVLNAIIASFEKQLHKGYRNTNTEMLELIGQARDSVLKDLQAKEADYQRFLATTPVILAKGQDRRTVQQDHLYKIGSQLSELRLRRIEVQAGIALIEKALQGDLSIPAALDRVTVLVPNRDRGVDGAITPAPGVAPRGPRVPLEEELLQLWLQEAKLLAVRPENHPDVVATRAQIESLREMLTPASARLRSNSDQQARYQELARLKVGLLRQELHDLDFTEQELTRLFQAEQKTVSAAVIHEVQDEAQRKGIEQARMLYDSILRRLDEISSVKDFGGFNAQVITPPVRGELALKKYLMVLGLGAFAGMMLGLGAGYLLENAAARRLAAQRVRPEAPVVHTKVEPADLPAAAAATLPNGAPPRAADMAPATAPEKRTGDWLL